MSNLLSESALKPMPAIIFDLDGTLTDSKPGILGCLGKVISARGLSHSGTLDHFIGPPVDEWTVELLPNGSNDDRAALAREYRACYDQEGWSNNSVYPGVSEMLTDLAQRGCALYVCTSKPQHFAGRILDLFALTPFFTAIYGDKAEFASHSKVDLLARLLQEQQLSLDSTWMIGDRSFDIDAAHANGIRCLAAGWGYGTPQEYATADALAATPAQVADLVLSASQAVAKG